MLTKNNTETSAVLGIYRLLVFFFVIFTLYYAQAIVIPLTVAALLTFLISPLVTRLEKWFGRVFSILLIVIAVFSAIGFTAYVFIKQLILFESNFKEYSDNIKIKLQSLHFPEWEIFKRLTSAFENLKASLFGEPSHIGQETIPSPIDINLLELSSYFTYIAKWLSGSLFNLIGSTGIVLLLVIFMLLNREDIRGRIIKLIGEHRISSTTSTMDDASQRIQDYLFRQLVVNVCFGLCVMVGLSLIGIPSPILWGVFAAILRFIPYIGSWIAAIVPIVLSFIVTDTWSVPFLTIAFFIILEMTTAYIIEPLYYGLGTGVSSFALILSAIFWTWLWGPIGLLLSIPLTVCLVVLGQHMTNMNFLSILLSHEKALTPQEECYHYLLSSNTNDSMDLIESYLKKDSLIKVYDSVLIPSIAQAEIDFNQNLIDAEKKEDVYQNIREILEFMGAGEKKPIGDIKGNILCLPAKTVRDELGVNILTQVLVNESFDASQTTSIKLSDIIELVEKNKPDAICIVGMAPFIPSQTRYLCMNLHQRLPAQPIWICLLGFQEVSTEVTEKFKVAGASEVIFSLAQTVESLQKIKTSKSVS